MANEAVIIELRGDGGDPLEFTVANGTAVSKGTLLKIADPRTASANAGSGDIFAGIAAAAKVASDGNTTLAAYRRGVFGLKADTGTVTVGQLVSTSGANLIKAATEAEIAAGKALGKALETTSTGEVIQILVGEF